MEDELDQNNIGHDPNGVEMPIIGKVKRDDVLGIVAMENYDAYDSAGYGRAFQLRVDEAVRQGQVLEGQESPEYGDIVEGDNLISGTLVGAYPSWMRRKQLKYEEGYWKMNLGGDYGWSKVLVVVEASLAVEMGQRAKRVHDLHEANIYGLEEGNTCANCYSVIRRVQVTDLRSDDAKKRHPLTEEQKTMLYCRCCHPGDTMIGGFF